ncbi:hypothetical protein N5P37_005847 [Trichoderma harzianum]|nr:hypothetical protein N5P37_005847 [Trichoderma harzianum]
MYRRASTDSFEEDPHKFPGSLEEEDQFRKWIEETDEPLHFQNVAEWMSANTNIGLNDESKFIQHVVDSIARNFQMESSPTATIRLPGYGYSPDKMPRYGCFPVIAKHHRIEWAAGPLFIKELCILKAIEEITNKPRWWDHVRDTRITDGWKKEMLALDWSNYLNHAIFTPLMADFCIKELKDKADLYEKTGLIPILDSEACVIKSDKLVPDDLKRELSIVSQKLLQALSDDDISHDGISFHLIDPSMFSLIYNRSRILPDRTINLSNCLEACGKGDIIRNVWDPNNEDKPSGIFDTSYQWLPCDVIVDENGHAKIDSYINNLHPVHHADMYAIIEKFIALALPAWDVIYRWPKDFWYQRISNQVIDYDCTVPDICGDRECIWTNMPAIENYDADHLIYEERKYLERNKAQKEILEKKQELPTADLEPVTFESTGCDESHLLNLKLERNEHYMEKYLRRLANEEGHEWVLELMERRDNDICQWFNETHPFRFPEPSVTSYSYLDRLRLKSSDVRSHDFFPQKSKRIQVIVKLTEIRLTPENPEYDGDLWNVDGRFNEHIVSTAIFCYDSDNVTDNHLYFDAAPDEEGLCCVPNIHSYDTVRAFGIKPGGKEAQVLGRVLVDPGWAIFYPNIYRHRQGSFSLVDRSRPGYRKVLKLCLVDPAIPIISTSNVPPQQCHWWTECKAHNEGLDIAERLPPELRDMIFNGVDFPIVTSEAKIIRQWLKVKRNTLTLFEADPQDESDDEGQGYEDQGDDDQDDEDSGDEDRDDEDSEDEDSEDEGQDEGSDSDESNNE